MITTSNEDYRRVDALEKVTGEAEFIDDLQFPGMLFAAILRSPYAHARIKSINIDNARKLDGVHAVIPGSESKEYVINLGIGDQHPMAVDKVRYMGEPVAAVIADNRWVAVEALDLIEITYEILEPVLTIKDALKDGAPLVHEKQENYRRKEGGEYKKNSNIFHHYKLRKGDIERGFADADLVIENTFVMPHRAHCQIEPHGAIARWTGEGKLELYSSTQSPFFVRNCLAEVFNIKSSDITVRVKYIGGGFGGKSDVTIEALVAFIARYVPTRYVKLTLQREEVFTGTVVGRGAEIQVKTGVKRSGEITAEKLTFSIASGAYGSYSLHIVTAGGHNGSGPYEIKNVFADSYGVYTNQPPVGAFRGYSHPESNWAVERQRHIIARKLGIDPVDFRLKNILKPGSFNTLGQKIEKHHGNLEGCLKAVAERLNKIDKEELKRKQPDRYFGKGIAAIMKSPVMATNSASSAILRFNQDGSVDVACSGVEMGQGTKTALRQIAADALGFPLSEVRIKINIDTDISPYGWQTIGSTTTWKAGMAILDAARKAIAVIKENASLVLGAPPDDLEYDGERVFLRGQKKKSLPVKDLIFGYMYPDGRVVGIPVQTYGTYIPEGLTHPDPETGQGNCAAEWTFGAQGALISIDPVTWEVTVLKLLTAIDAGKVINPVLARNQIIGGMVQELGGALSERIIYSGEGTMRNNNFTDYKIPTPEDVADTQMEVIFFETPEPIGPFGARGIAEHGTVGICAVIGNALSDALGVEIKELPLSAETINKYMQQKRK